MKLETLTEDWTKARLTNQTSNGYVSKIDTLTQPITADSATGQYLIEASGFPGSGSVTAQNNVIIHPYGVGSDNGTFSFRVITWNKIPTNNNAVPWQWRPTVLAEFACTLSTDTGVAGGTVVATERYADTITMTYPADSSSIEVCSNAANFAAHVVMDLKGPQLIEFSFTTGGSATSCNALLRQY